MEWVLHGAIDGGGILPDNLEGAKRRRIGRDRVERVLLVLADHANAGGVAWPSQETIAIETRLDRRDVRKGLAVLLEGGWIECVGNGKGPGNSSRYRLLMAGLPLQGEMPGISGQMAGKAEGNGGEAEGNGGEMAGKWRGNGPQMAGEKAGEKAGIPATNNEHLTKPSSSSVENSTAGPADDDDEFRKVLELVAEYRRQASPRPVIYPEQWLTVVRDSVAAADGYRIHQELAAGDTPERIAHRINTFGRESNIVARTAPRDHPPECECQGTGTVERAEVHNGAIARVFARCETVPT